MPFILGKKIGMTRVMLEDKTVPVTLVEAGPCYITQIKTVEIDGYNAIQVGYGEKRSISKPLQGHIKKAGNDLKNIKDFFEFRVEDVNDYKLGQVIDTTQFAEGDLITIAGFSKGRGFTGVIKRHGFAGSPKTHGHRHDERAPGSIGSGYPEHVFKGIRMAGRSGNTKHTFKNNEIVNIDTKSNIIVVKGSVPGARNSLLMIKSSGK